MIEFFLTNYYSIEKPSFFLGFLFGICVAGLFFKYRKTSTFETKNLKCIVFKDDKKLVTPVEVILKDAKPHFTICPFFENKICSITNEKCSILSKQTAL